MGKFQQGCTKACIDNTFCQNVRVGCIVGMVVCFENDLIGSTEVVP
jgi:hypothetical protein